MDAQLVAELSLCGVVTGILSTVTGQGGALFLVVALAFCISPHAALVLSAPALLLGNCHRAFAFRNDIHWNMANRFSLGAFPGAVVGGLVASEVPDVLLRIVLVVTAALALAKAFGWIQLAVTQRMYSAAGLGVGLLTGVSGGAGILLAPIILAAGLSGRGYIATQAPIAIAIHVGRALAYSEAGMFRDMPVFALIVVTGALFAGNAIAEHIRARISARTISVTEYGTMAICTGLAVWGVGQ